MLVYVPHLSLTYYPIGLFIMTLAVALFIYSLLRQVLLLSLHLYFNLQGAGFGNRGSQIRFLGSIFHL